uniref:Alcohol dehydrogenase n=1 Tax=Micromonospora maris (strain DSM 45365 / JCM 31040 / NBRC 109089 / NRRL B-24793 / AB-18-032) TaxID=263358 RepID=G1C882_MICM1|nr:alcohol dehydrogenase [Micromonospora maris AB-18-032]
MCRVSNAFRSPGDPVHVNIDAARCVGAGQCVRTDPTVFGQSDEGTVRLLRGSLPGSLRSVVTEAAALCPAQAITVTGTADPPH